LVSLLWTQRQDIGPSARFGHALAYDESRSRTLLVGGDGLGTLCRDTWLWDGETWTQVEDIGPSGRAGHAIAYDAGRQRVVLFGGKGASPLSDTWEWDGEAWTQLEDTGPSARSRHALAYDSARSRVVLFGGIDGAVTPLGDTWEWDGDEWTQVADTGPAARAGHAMCFEASAGRTVLFGGVVGSDTWAWNGTAWTEINDVGPAPYEGTGLVSTGQGIILFGGNDPSGATPTLSRLTWRLDGADWTERQDMGPAHRHGHGMAYDAARTRVVLFGGCGAPPAIATPADLFADTWELPAGPEGPGPDPGVAVALVSFVVDPGTVGPGETFTLTVVLDQPAPAATSVAIALDGMDVGSLPVNTGETMASVPVLIDDLGLPPGTYTWTATLGEVTLSAPLTVM
jgi:Galactose oxidase, central domain